VQSVNPELDLLRARAHFFVSPHLERPFSNLRDCRPCSTALSIGFARDVRASATNSKRSSSA